MKASGITKCSVKKGGDNTGESSMSKASSLSHLQVDGEVHFHVNPNGGIANYSAVPIEKSIEVSQRTYSKKFPVSGLVAPKEEMPFAIHLPVKAKSQPQSSARSPRWSVIKLEPNSALPRKRKAKEEDCFASSKVQKVSAQSQDASPSCSPRISSRSRSSPNSSCDVNTDFDLEVEIVDEVMPSPPRSLRKLNTASPQTGKKKSKFYFDHKMNQNEITMNEADIAPSGDTFPDGQPGASKSMQCLAANGTDLGQKAPAEKRATSTQTQSSDHCLPDFSQSLEMVSRESNSQNINERPSTSKATHQSMPTVNRSPIKRGQERECSSKNLKGKQVASPETQQFCKRELKGLIDDILETKFHNRSLNIQAAKVSLDPSSKNHEFPSKNMNKKLASPTYQSSDYCLSNSETVLNSLNTLPENQSMSVANKSPSKREPESSSENLNGKQVASSESQLLFKKSRELKNLMIDVPEKSSKNSQELDYKRQTPSTSKCTGQSSGPQGKRPKKSRELANLYKNLDEIAWAQESSFKKLLRDPNYIRHSDRSPKQEPPRSRNRQKLKGLCKLFPKATKKARDMLELKSKHQTSHGKDKPKLAQKPKVSGLGKVKPITIKEEIMDEETDVFYMLNPGSSGEDNKGKQQDTVAKRKAAKSDSKLNSLPKVKAESSKARFSSLKSTDRSPSPEALRSKKRLKCISFVSIKTPKDSSASTSGLQKNGRSKSLPSLPRSTKTEQSCNGSDLSHSSGRLVGSEGDELILACQNASKLQVRVQPLEHTNFWNNDFYEGFRKHFLDQALKKALESREMDSSYVMFQDMLGSLVGPGNGRRRRPEEEALRSSARQSEGAFRYKEIVVKRQSNYMQLVLVPNTAKQNSLTVEAMKELKEALLLAKKDPNCRAVLINSSGPYFCTGIDLAPLVGNNKKQAAEEIALSIRDLVMTLGVFPKPVVAAVNGAALGFGVSLLTYCDVVLASDKATFCLPATKIGYIPEGGVTYTLPQVVGSSVASEMLMQGRRITAEQACKYGLVSEVIWPTRLMNEVIPRLQNIISQPLQGLEATKTMVRCRLWDKLKMHVERERELLCEHWASTVCQNNIKTLLQTGWLLE